MMAGLLIHAKKCLHPHYSFPRASSTRQKSIMNCPCSRLYELIMRMQWSQTIWIKRLIWASRRTLAPWLTNLIDWSRRKVLGILSPRLRIKLTWSIQSNQSSSNQWNISRWWLFKTLTSSRRSFTLKTKTSTRIVIISQTCPTKKLQSATTYLLMVTAP